MFWNFTLGDKVTKLISSNESCKTAAHRLLAQLWPLFYFMILSFFFFLNSQTMVNSIFYSSSSSCVCVWVCVFFVFLKKQQWMKMSPWRTLIEEKYGSNIWSHTNIFLIRVFEDVWVMMLIHLNCYPCQGSLGRKPWALIQNLWTHSLW